MQLPKNAKKVGDTIYVELGRKAAKDSERREGRFAIPASHMPRISEAFIAFYFRFPDGKPYSGDEFPVPTDSIRVVIRPHANAEAARSIGALRNIQPKDGPQVGIPWLVQRKYDLAIYQYRINETAKGTYYSIAAKDGSSVLADDPGPWARTYMVYRPLSPHIEISYLPNKSLVRDLEHFAQDMTAIDREVIKQVKRFQSD